MKVSEDAVTLYGFVTEEELKMFNYLIGVNGIGPKNAIQILSQMTPDRIVMAVLADDIKELSLAPGIGKKTAAKLILELKDKFTRDDLMPAGIIPDLKILNTAVNDAVDALIALGYTQSESVTAVAGIEQDGMSSEQLIKTALKKLAAV
jgi:Holliday junction DNA helicase RuvA